jgi:hypothetical protein
MQVQPSTGPAGRVVVAHADRKAQRTLQKLLGATLRTIDVVADADALIEAVGEDPTVVAIVDAALAHGRVELCQRKARAWIAVPGETVDAAATDALLAGGWQHVIAHPSSVIAEELLATVQKLLRGDLFGIEKYMAWGAEVRSYALDDCRDRDDAVATVARDVVAVGLPDRVGSLVSVIADELIANALYAAPVDASGARFRSGDPRDKPRPLTGRDVVTVRWATDARFLAIEVRDRWGTLDPATVGVRLATSAKQTSNEGGMGLPLAYACCNQLVVGSEPDKMTEMIALLDVRYKPTELGRAASFHGFKQVAEDAA